MKHLLCAILLLSALAIRAEVAGLGKGEEPPSMYELTARSDLVVKVQIVSGSLKRAQVRVLEVFRGTARPGQDLEIAFRDLNTSLGKEDRIVFVDGESEALFLVPELDSEEKPRGGNRYTLTRGRFGRVVLPREGEDIYLDAIREFARLVALKDHRELFNRLKGLLQSQNPILVDAGLTEVLKLDLVDRELAPEIMGFYNDPAPKRRLAALKLMRRLFSDFKDRESHPEFKESVLPPVIVLARNDPEETVRVAAVDALGAWGGATVTETLKEIARQDSAQAVRYEAQLVLLRAQGQEAPKTPPAVKSP